MLIFSKEKYIVSMVETFLLTTFSVKLNATINDLRNTQWVNECDDRVVDEHMKIGKYYVCAAWCYEVNPVDLIVKR